MLASRRLRVKAFPGGGWQGLLRRRNCRDDGAPPSLRLARATVIDAAGGWLALTTRFLALSATTLALGAWVFGRLVLARLPQAGDDTPHAAMRALAQRVAGWSAAVLALTAAARMLVAVADVPAADVGVVGTTVFQGLWGRALVVQGLAAGIAAAFLLARAPTIRWPAPAEVALAVVGLTPPFLAHAGSAAELRALAIVVDAVHGVAAAAWVGALVLVTIVFVRHRSADDAPARGAALIAAFHPIAVVAAPTVFVTGLLTAFLRMGLPEGIASPTYSGLFVAKLLLAGVTGWIGAGHSKLATRRASAVAPATVSRSLLAECAFAVLVLALTAVLVGTAPLG